jgi:hypothetical protein
MKRILIILACWAVALPIFAQDTQTTPSSSGTNDLHTLFNKGGGKCKIPLGYFIELNGEYTHFGHKNEFLPGMSMGVILNHHWTIGVTGNFLSNSQGSYHHHADKDSISTGNHRSSLSGGYGGLLLEYTLFPRSKVHVSFPLTIGSGYLYHSHHTHLSDSTDTQNKWVHHGEHFLVIEPGVNLEINVVKHLRIDLGVSYRYSPERNHMITSPDMLNQLTGKLAFRFGKF